MQVEAVISTAWVMLARESADGIAIQSLQQLQAKEALPALHRLLEDTERSTYGALVTVAVTAKAAIAALETN